MSIYLKGKRFFIEPIDDDDFIDILEGCISDLKRVIERTYKSICKETKNKKSPVDNHFTGVFYNNLVKAYKGILERSTLSGPKIQKQIKVSIGETAEIRNITFAPQATFGFACEEYTVINMLEDALVQLDVERIKPSKNAVAPYIRFELNTKKTYRKLIIDNL